MNKLRLLLIAPLLPLWATAQTLTVNPPSLSFGNATETQTDSLSVMVSNPTQDTLSVAEIRFYDTYGQHAFSTSAKNMKLAPLQTMPIWVRFHPRHNIAHNSEMVLVTNSKYGDVAINLSGQGVYSLSYYAPTQNKSEEDLKLALKSLLAQNYTAKSYNEARDLMYMLVDNKKTNGQKATVNTLECIYTGKILTSYTSRQDVGSKNFNAEHTFPQSLFSSNLPMLSDLHHLFPTDATANGKRSNDPFGVVSGTPSWTVGGSKLGSGVFEPRDEQKGATARAMMYFVSRYDNYSSYFNNQETILRKWHKDFAPDSIEERRNADIFSIQNNRNPFVDYPQLIDRITFLSTTSSQTPLLSLDRPQSMLDFGTFPNSDPVSSTFHYVIVNEGNQPIQFNNFSVSDTSFKLLNNNLQQGVTLQAGDALTLRVQYHGTLADTYKGDLSFNTSNPNQSHLVIPMIARIEDVAADDPYAVIMRAVQVYPNPITDMIQIVMPYTSDDTFEFVIYTEKGEEVKRGHLPERQAVTRISASDMAEGYYYLEIITPVWTYRYPVMHL